jgi:hypothetical protein
MFKRTPIGETNLVRLSRQTNPSQVEKARPRAQWRRIAFGAAPAFLATGNLISAHFEKSAAFERGNNKYIELEQTGERERKKEVAIGKSNGEQRAIAILSEARNHARADLEIANKSRDTSIEQGKYVGAIPIALSEGLIEALYGESERLAQLIFEQQQEDVGASLGIDMSVDAKTGKYEVRQVATHAQERINLFLKKMKVSDEKELQIKRIKDRMITRGSREFASFIGTPFCWQRSE